MSTLEMCDFCALPETKSTPLFEELYGIKPVNVHELEDKAYEPPMQIIEDVFDEPETHFVAFNIFGATDLHLMYCAKKLEAKEHVVSAAQVENQKQAGEGLHTILSKLHELTPGTSYLVLEHGEGIDEVGNPIVCGACHVSHTHKHIIAMSRDYYQDYRASVEVELDDIGWNVAENMRILQDLYTYEELGEDERKSPYLDIGVYRADGTTEHIVYLQKSAKVPNTRAASPRSQILLDLVGRLEYDDQTQEKYGRLLTNWSDVAELAEWGDKMAQELADEELENIIKWRNIFKASREPQSEYVLGDEGCFSPSILAELEDTKQADLVHYTHYLTSDNIKEIARAWLRTPEERVNMVKNLEAQVRILYKETTWETREQAEQTALYMLAPDSALKGLMRAIKYNMYHTETSPYYKDKLPTKNEMPYQYVNRWIRGKVATEVPYDETLNTLYEILDIGKDTAENNTQNPTTRQLMYGICDILAYPIPNLPLKFAKDTIITKATGCNRMPRALVEYKNFDEENYHLIKPYAETMALQGKKVLLRLFDDNGRRGTGYPIVTINTPAELSRLTTMPHFLEANDEAIIDVRSLTHIQSISREISIIRPMHNTDTAQGDKQHNDALRQVRLGGGARIQLDNLHIEQGSLICDFTSTFVFDDAPPRETSLMSIRSQTLPHVTVPFSARYEHGALVPEPFQHDLHDVLQRKDLSSFGKHILGCQFNQDSMELAKLFGALLYADQRLQYHSIEIMFSTILVEGDYKAPQSGHDPMEPRLFTEVVDFDGIDTLPAWLHGTNAVPNHAYTIARDYEIARIRHLITPWVAELYAQNHKVWQ